MLRSLLMLIFALTGATAYAGPPDDGEPKAGEGTGATTPTFRGATSNQAAALDMPDSNAAAALAPDRETVDQRIETPVPLETTDPQRPGARPDGETLLTASTPLERPSSPRGSRKHESVPWYRNGLLSLTVVLAVIATIAYLLRKLVPAVRTMNGGAIEIMGRTHLTPKQSIALVRVGQRVLLVGISAERLNTLCEIDRPEEVAELLIDSSRRQSGMGRGRDSVFHDALGGAADEFEESSREPRETVPGRSERLDQARGQLRGLLGKLRTVQEGKSAR